MVYALLYRSDAVKQLDGIELEKLIEVSVKNNAINDITGLLIYKDKQFMQLIEGEKSSIFKLHNELLADNRHTNLEVLFHGNIANRNVITWSCGFLNANEGDIDGEYVDFIYDIARHEFNEDSKLIQNHLLSFAVGE